MFSKGATASFPTFFSSVSSSYHLVKKSFSVDGFSDPMFYKFVCFCRNGTLCELVCEHLFFLFPQKSCSSVSFIVIENIFAPTRILSASVIDIKFMNSIADTPWIFLKRPPAFISPDYRSRISQKNWNFFFLLKKFSLTKKKLLQNHSSTMQVVVQRLRGKATEIQICLKKRENSQFFLVGEMGIFFGSRFLHSTYCFLKFEKLLRE